MSATSPLVPTLVLQGACVVTIITAGITGRLAERHRDAAYGMISVLCMISSAGLIAVLLYRMSR